MTTASRIRCAAVRAPDGAVYTGEDHGEAINDAIYFDQVASLLLHGFLDMDGKFLTRKEAYDRAVECGQIKDDGGTRCLNSGMLRRGKGNG